jgi:uncharacterized surface anchored protein
MRFKRKRSTRHYRLFHKKASMLLIVVMLVVQTLYGISFSKAALADGASEGTISPTIIDSVYMVVYNDPNRETVAENVYKQGSLVDLYYTFSLPDDHSYKDGDTFVFHLPDQFKVFNPLNNVPLYNGDVPLGSFSLGMDHKVVITFNEFVANHDQVKGTLRFRTQFDTTTITGSVVQTIKIPIRSGDQIFTLTFKPNTSTTIEKKVDPPAYNPSSLHWTININKSLDTIAGATVTDTIPAGLGAAANVKVYPAQMDLNGNVASIGPELTGGYTVDSLSPLKISFDQPISSAYQIVFDTPVTDDSVAATLPFTNQAALDGNKGEHATASASATITRGSYLAKRAASYDSVTQTIYWEIDYNFRQKTIPQADALLTDEFDNRQQLVAGSLAVYPVTINPANGSATVSTTPFTGYNLPAYTPGANKNGFALQFNSDVTTAYRIKYQTTAVNRVENPNAVTIGNTVKWKGTSQSDSQTINQIIVNKTRGTVDYGNQTVQWTIRLNQDKYTMNDLSLTDRFTTGGLKLMPGTLQVTPDSGPSAAYTVQLKESNPPAQNDGFVLHFTEPIQDPYTVTYKTTFDNQWLTANWLNTPAQFINRADVSWKANPADSDYKTTWSQASFNPRAEIQKNGWKSGAYNAVSKKITWTVGLNYNRDTLTNPILTDKLAAPQVLVPGSLKVYQMKIDAGSGNPGKGTEITSGYTITAPSEANGNTLSVKLPGSQNTAYYVVFDTTLDGALIDSSSIANTAVLKDGTDDASRNLTASVTVKYGGEYVNKDGAQSGEKMNWTVYINRGQSEIHDAELFDQPSDGQLLIPDSFQLPDCH